MGLESHHSNHWRQMCVFVTVLLCLFLCLFVCLWNCVGALCVYEIALLCCVCGRECNNCLRLIPECDELSVPVKYLAHSHTLCVCCAVLLYTVFAVPCHCTLSLLWYAIRLHCVFVRVVSSHCMFAVLHHRIVSSHCVFAVLLYAIPISQWPTSVNCMGCQ